MASLCIPDFTADSELGWPHCQTPKPVDASQRQSLKTPRLWFAPVVEKHMENICDSTFPNECCIPLFLLYITLALSLLFIWAQSLLHLQSQHKSSAGEWFFPLDPGGTAVGSCWWHSQHCPELDEPWAQGANPRPGAAPLFPRAIPKLLQTPANLHCVVSSHSPCQWM